MLSTHNYYNVCFADDSDDLKMFHRVDTLHGAKLLQYDLNSFNEGAQWIFFVPLNYCSVL